MASSNLRAILKPSGYKVDRKFGLKEQLFHYEQSPMIAYGTDKGSHIEYEDATDEGDLASKIETTKKLALDNLSGIVVKYSVQEIEGEKIITRN